MKRLLGLVIALFIYQFSDAQFYAGADGALVLPFKNLASEIDYGYGPSVNFGYSFKKSFDASLNYQVLFFGPLRPNFHISSESLVLKYKIVNLKKCVPYFGFRTGIFHSSAEVPYLVTGNAVEFRKKKENAFGMAPVLGLLVDSGWNEKLKIDVSGSFSKIWFKRNYKYLNFQVGLKYYF